MPRKYSQIKTRVSSPGNVGEPQSVRITVRTHTRVFLPAGPTRGGRSRSRSSAVRASPSRPPRPPVRPAQLGCSGTRLPWKPTSSSSYNPGSLWALLTLCAEHTLRTLSGLWCCLVRGGSFCKKRWTAWEMKTHKEQLASLSLFSLYVALSLPPLLSLSPHFLSFWKSGHCYTLDFFLYLIIYLI